MDNDVTRVLDAISAGDASASDALLPLVYEELRRLGSQRLSRERAGHTLQPTALVHEAFLRLVGSEEQSWENRGHFFAAAAEAMRRILIDNARQKRSQKRGGELARVPLDDDAHVATFSDDHEELLSLDEALTALANHDAQAAELVKLRYFGGLTIDQAAEVLGVSPRTAKRYWTYARAWLKRAIDGETQQSQ
ncbi:MAG TPA: RNA polymerase subunit sigma [Planctomycetaceae bacterium]|nr:RNA polymerase subunit sigma [Planctomycetaceae bacterium]